MYGFHYPNNWPPPPQPNNKTGLILYTDNYAEWCSPSIEPSAPPIDDNYYRVDYSYYRIEHYSIRAHSMDHYSIQAYNTFNVG